jgi:hypothetical protein
VPVSPDDGAAHASAVGDIAARVELWLLEQLAEVLRTGADRDDWAEQVLTRIRLWRARADSGVAGAAAELQEAVADALFAASSEGHALALVDLPDGVRQPPAPARAVLASADTLGQALSTALQSTPRLLEQILRETVAAGALEVTGGKVTRLQAAQHTLDRLVGQGIKGFRDSAGRNWSLTSYVEMAVRTESGRVAVDAHMDALAAAGQDLVEISDSPRECSLCRPWERKVLSLSGQVGAVLLPSEVDDRTIRVDVAGTLASARSAGLFHPNCTHSARLYVAGTTRKPAASDPDGYDAKQRQRSIERHIRDWKRREAIALDDAAAARARAKVRDWQQALRDHVDEHDLKRLRRREQIGVAL